MVRSAKYVVGSALERHHDVLENLWSGPGLAQAERAAEMLLSTITKKKKVLICGNGGSAADSQHLASELVGKYHKDRVPLAALALTTDSSSLTSIGNDYGYADVFARQIMALGSRGDLLIVITTGGRSKNILAAVRTAKKRGMRVIALTGAIGLAGTTKADCTVAVPSRETARVQEMHELIYHAWCEYVDANFAK